MQIQNSFHELSFNPMHVSDCIRCGKLGLAFLLHVNSFESVIPVLLNNVLNLNSKN